LVGFSEKRAVLPLKGTEDRHEVWATVDDALPSGYDAVRLIGQDASGKLVTQWAFKNPNQLRSRFAAFDPARIGSSDLLAGVAPISVGALLSALERYRPEERD